MDMDTNQPKRGRGRPGRYATSAERARAWRQRQKDLIAQAQQPTAPVVVEKVVEKVVFAPAAPSKTGGKGTTSAPDAGRLIALLQSNFGAHGGEDRAKRLRTNSARAASTARDILGMFAAYEAIPEAEKAFLEQAARFFDGLNAGFEVTQHGAKQAKAKADAERQAKREAKIAETILDTFGEVLDLGQVRATAEALQRFASRAVCAAEATRRGVDRAYFFVTREFELRAALKANDAQAIAREVAEVRLEAGEAGRTWQDGDEICYSAGWEDFSSWGQRAK